MCVFGPQDMNDETQRKPEHQRMFAQTRLVGKEGGLGIMVRGKKIEIQQAKGRKPRKRKPEGDQMTLGRGQTKIVGLFNFNININ